MDILLELLQEVKIIRFNNKKAKFLKASFTII